jgi:hypothetical protein
MGKQKLTKEQVHDIKLRLDNRETHQSIADDYGVSRITITKIKKSMVDPFHKNARWSDVPLIPNTTLDLVHIPYPLAQSLLSLNDIKAGKLIKSILKLK